MALDLRHPQPDEAPDDGAGRLNRPRFFELTDSSSPPDEPKGADRSCDSLEPQILRGRLAEQRYRHRLLPYGHKPMRVLDRLPSASV